VPEQKCSTVLDEQCVEKVEQRCGPVKTPVARVQTDKQCTTVFDKQCKTVTEQECSTVTEQQCTTFTEKQCTTTTEKQC
jgi:hypothetical protein